MAWRRGVLMSIAATLAALVVAALVALNLRGEAPLPATAEEVPATAAQVARGAYLARVGSCAGCHTARGGAAYAGGRGIETPFGKVFAGNLTPDVATGLGAWSSADFWRALHHGRSRDGRLKAIPGTAFHGMRFITAYLPASSETMRSTSSSPSFTPSSSVHWYWIG